MLEFTCEYYEFIHVWAVLWRFDTAAAFGWRQQLWKKRSKTAMLFHPRFQHYDQFARFFKKEKTRNDQILVCHFEFGIVSTVLK